MTDEQRLAYQQELSLAGQALGNWLEEAGNQPNRVPSEVWRNIAEAAARVVAAATALAGETEAKRD